eukprot:COSAG03_NODE_5879_length_1156_cov_5.419111_3_plen_41_part_01
MALQRTKHTQAETEGNSFGQQARDRERGRETERGGGDRERE